MAIFVRFYWVIGEATLAKIYNPLAILERFIWYLAKFCHLGKILESFGYIWKVLLGNWRSHFGKNLQSFGNIKKVYLVYGKVLNQLWHNFFALWQIFIDVLNGRMQKTIWSHWVRVLVCGIGLVSINFLRRHFKCRW